MRVCSTCNLEKDEILFRKNRSQCLECYGKVRAQYRSSNKEKIKEEKKVFYEQNKDQIKKDSNDYYHGNKDKRKKYLELNKEELNSKRRIIVQGRYKNEPTFKIRKLVSGSILQSLLSHKSYKNGSILKFLPYSIQELKEHLEKQFEPWMSWSNWGKYNSLTWDNNNSTTWTWQIDHIVPHSIFQYSSMEDDSFKRCWALDNLRPLSAKQNYLDGVNRTRHQ